MLPASGTGRVRHRNEARLDPVAALRIFASFDDPMAFAKILDHPGNEQDSGADYVLDSVDGTRELPLRG
jgi:hypothetical protein